MECSRGMLIAIAIVLVLALVAEYCPQMAEEVKSRMGTHVWDVSAFIDIAATGPAKGLSSLQSHLAAL